LRPRCRRNCGGRPGRPGSSSPPSAIMSALDSASWSRCRPRQGRPSGRHLGKDSEESWSPPSPRLSLVSSCLLGSSESAFLVGGVGVLGAQVHVEVGEQLARRLGIGAWFGDDVGEVSQVRAYLVAHVRPPQIDHALGLARRRSSRQRLRNQQADDLGQRPVAALGDAGGIRAAGNARRARRRDSRKTPTICRAPIASTRACSTASNTARAISPVGASRACSMRCDGAASARWNRPRRGHWRPRLPAARGPAAAAAPPCRTAHAPRRDGQPSGRRARRSARMAQPVTRFELLERLSRSVIGSSEQ